jgi:hypothetical protein
MKFQINQVNEMDNKTRKEKLNKWQNYYLRGAIDLEELIYLVANTEKQLDFEDLADMLLNVLEDNTKEEKSETRKRLINLIIERGI